MKRGAKEKIVTVLAGVLWLCLMMALVSHLPTGCRTDPAGDAYSSGCFILLGLFGAFCCGLAAWLKR